MQQIAQVLLLTDFRMTHPLPYTLNLDTIAFLLKQEHHQHETS